MIFELNGTTPNIDDSVYVAPGSYIVGNVEISTNASIWFNVTIRGDNDKIFIGEGSNIQDASVIHVDKSYPVMIGSNVTIGHKCIIHGCTIEDGALIGMGSIILNGAHIKKGAVVAAGSVVKENMVVEEDTLIAGVPAKPIKKVSEKVASQVREGNDHYIKNSVNFLRNNII